MRSLGIVAAALIVLAVTAALIVRVVTTGGVTPSNSSAIRLDDEARIRTLLDQEKMKEAMSAANAVLDNIFREMPNASKLQIETQDWPTYRAIMRLFKEAALRVEVAAVTAEHADGKQGSTAQAWMLAYADMLVQSSARLKTFIEGSEAASADVHMLRTVTSQLRHSALIYLKHGQVAKAQSALEQAEPTLVRLEEKAMSWRAQSEIVYTRMFKCYLSHGQDKKTFLDQAMKVIAPYKDTDWICRVAMSVINNDLSGFADTLDSPWLYAYYLSLEKVLRENGSDPAVTRLYYELGATASFLGMDIEAIKWYQIFLKRAPDSALATTVRRLISFCEERILAGVDAASKLQEAPATKTETGADGTSSVGNSATGVKQSDVPSAITGE